SNVVLADCECGYSLNSTSDPEFAVFTDLMENDFLHTVVENLTTIGWQPQVYQMDVGEARGSYGKNFTLNNVEANPLKNKFDWSGEAENGGDAGMRLWARNDYSSGYLGAAEVVSVRNDQRYGSFRASMKLATADSGTCGGFFWFFNDSQEIDMEFLSREFNQSEGAVNLVLHTIESVADGYDASGTPQYKVAHLPFRPDDKYHEYRFDWVPGRVVFYIDGEFLWKMEGHGVPETPGRLYLNHWSNGDARWSGGPPPRDESMTISYIKAYFNSTDEERNDKYKERCESFNASQVCTIPEQMGAPDLGGDSGNQTARTYFFTQEKDKAPGQIIAHTNNNPYSGAARPSTTIFASVMVVLFSCFLVL
ncbi:glycoside hydrolase family 16 protein, partial [Aaosphaeria arxii CBS 175.79]